ncbi:MAG: MarR family winged helix-turn-helix transcriptional regulator [Butyrivibrio sp.]
MKLADIFERVYNKFKLYFYRKVFEEWKDRETSLTTVETFCMEIIYSMGNPTINEFAKAANISSPNAAYKVNNLIKKGYLRKVQSQTDKREYHLEVTDKYVDYYSISHNYVEKVVKRVEERFPKEEVDIFRKMLVVMADELMPESDI